MLRDLVSRVLGRAGPRAGRQSSFAVGVLVVAVALLMVPGPTVGAFPHTGASGSSASPAVTPVPAATPVTPVAHASVLPGTGANLPYSNLFNHAQYVRFANQSLAASAAWHHPHAAAPLTPSPQSPYIPTGTFNAFVANSSDHNDFLSGITVQAYPEQGGQFCPSFLCSPQPTGSNGEVNVTCPVGKSYVTFTKSFWAENQTYSTCQLNQTVTLGTVYLLQDGTVSGRVLADIAGTPAITGVLAQGESRDYSIVSNPGVTTNTTGGFDVPIPPGVAGRIDFTAPGQGFQNNFTFISVPAGGHADLGKIYLEPNSLVEAKLYDAVTGLPINGAFQTPNSLTVCSSVTGSCGTQGPPGSSGNIVQAEGPPGYDFVDAQAVGYLQNQSPIGYVPGTSPGNPFCVPNSCKIFLVPMGAVEVKVDVSGSPSPAFGLGLWVLQDCGMDGYEVGIPKFNPVTFTYNNTVTDCLDGGCLGPGGTTIAAAFPLRNDIQVFPDTTGLCGFGPQWPIPGDLPVWGNETAANATPDEMTVVPYSVDLTPGSYIGGNVYVAGTSAAPAGGFAVQVQSRISPTLSTYPFNSGTSPNMCGTFGPTAFCAPAPPGPDIIQASAGGFPANATELSVPWVCCSAQLGAILLSQATIPSFNAINLTAQATVNGTVIIAGGTAPVPFASVTVCPASPTSLATCAEGLVNASGGFSVLAAPLGWDVLHGSGSGYASNSEWLFVGGGTIVAPPLPLAPLATLEGLVTATNGSAIIDASIDYCTIAQGVSSQSCRQQLGSGLTTSEGYYQGLVVGGWLPWATYEVYASAPGFMPDWTWVNASTNGTTVVPNFVLAPVGGSIPSHGDRPLSVTNPAGTWVGALLIDNSTGKGVMTSGVQACAVSSGLCTPFLDSSNTGGVLNGSLPTGVYNLTVAANGYTSITILVTVPAGVPLFFIGTILLTPLPWVFGQVLLAPWSTIEVNVTGLVNPVFLALAPPATVLGCAIFCGQATPDSSSGTYQVQTYPGFGDTLFVNPSYPGSFVSAAGGFIAGTITFNDTQRLTNLTPGPALPIFVGVSGIIYNAASCTGPIGLQSCTDPARWVSVQVQTSGRTVNGVAIVSSNGGGEYWAFVPGGDDPGATRVTATDPTMYFSRFEVVNASLGVGPGQNLTYVAPPLELTQFGYGYAFVVDSKTGLPVANVGVTSKFNDPINGNSGSTTGETNGAGFANITAPSGASVDFNIGGSNDYNNTSFAAPVPIGNATNLDTYFSHLGGPVLLPPWGWVESLYVNYSAPGGYVGGVIDAVNGQPLPGASVSVSTANPNLPSGSSSQTTNFLGEFVSDAPLGPSDSLVINLPAYQSNTTHPLNITPGEQYVAPLIRLVGNGVIASQVIAEPSGLPVPAATVTICTGANGTTHSPSCEQTITNATGRYWANVPPGRLSISVKATGFVSNYTELVTAYSDVWEAVPAIQVVEDGVITGTVRGVPIGLAIGGATVKACSPIGGVPTGPCSFIVTALADGTFSLPVVPSTYILATSAVNFNTSYLPVSVQPGETVDLGLVLLTEYGILTGSVVDNATGLPLANVTVGGCPVDTLLPCLVPGVTDLTGTYHVAAPPGGNHLVMSLANYLDGYTSAIAVSGATKTVATVSLTPIVTESTVHVSGKVVIGTAVGGPIAGATVALWNGQTVAASMSTGASGTFSLAVTTGSYVLRASAPGYVPAAQNLVLIEPLSGLVLSLAPFGWTVSGAVTDGLTGAPISGVAIWSGSSVVALTGAAGTYSASLANGTYSLEAIAGGTAGGMYAPVSFEVDVASAAVVRSVNLYPNPATLSVTVESAVNQSAVVSAHVTISGAAIDGAQLAKAGPVDPSGGFQFAAYVGTYTVTVTAPGYQMAILTVTAGLTNAPLVVQLSPSSSGAHAAGLAPWSYGAIGLVLIGAAVAGVALAGRRPKKGAP
ncbi:MAG: carboxypeptidase regulatory-like domain-containing protein [Thermoplasmata archaeon]|nr:carboxypeptidase regulatory-like domain-containing protein [Thermoplasmata archaeon]